MSKRKVLIPLDGSEFSRQIVGVVQNFFDARDVSLVLFRVAQPPSVPLEIPSARDMIVGSYPMSGSYEAYNAAMERSYALIEQEMETLRSEIADELRPDAERLREQGYSVRVEVQFGEPAPRIVQYVSDESIGLVAMATHGRSGVSRLVLGSVAERVLRGSAAPVLLLRPQDIAPQQTVGRKLAGVLGHSQSLRLAVATDGSTFGHRAVRLAANLQSVVGGTLTVLVTSSGRDGAAKAQEIMKETLEHIANVHPPAECTPLVGYADEVLLNYLHEHPCNLLVVGAFADRGQGAPIPWARPRTAWCRKRRSRCCWSRAIAMPCAKSWSVRASKMKQSSTPAYSWHRRSARTCTCCMWRHPRQRLTCPSRAAIP